MSSLPCLNGSFLVSNDGHFTCSRNNHGINFDIAAQCFDAIKSIRHKKLKEMVSLFLLKAGSQLVGKLK